MIPVSIWWASCAPTPYHVGKNQANLRLEEIADDSDLDLRITGSCHCHTTLAVSFIRQPINGSAGLSVNCDVHIYMRCDTWDQVLSQQDGIFLECLRSCLRRCILSAERRVMVEKVFRHFICLMPPAHLPPVCRLQVWGPHIIENEVRFTDIRSTLVGLSVWL